LKILFLLFAISAAALGWTCPACSTGNDGAFCSGCGLPQVPEGMEYVAPCTVSVNGETVPVPAFFIDSEPVSCRDMLEWLSQEIVLVDHIPIYITGQESLLMPGENLGEDFRNIVFVRYTPWVIYRDGGGGVTNITVQTGSFDYPATSVTFDAARLYLSDTGRMLPSAAQLTAAAEAGVVEPMDTWTVMSSYSDFLTMTLSGVLGTSTAGLSMFSDNRSDEERIMWEWSGDAWGQSLDSISDFLSPYALIVKPLQPAVYGTGLREMGYFNIVFRGVVNMPWFQQT